VPAVPAPVTLVSPPAPEGLGSIGLPDDEVPLPPQPPMPVVIARPEKMSSALDENRNRMRPLQRKHRTNRCWARPIT